MNTVSWYLLHLFAREELIGFSRFVIMLEKGVMVSLSNHDSPMLAQSLYRHADVMKGQARDLVPGWRQLF